MTDDEFEDEFGDMFHPLEPAFMELHEDMLAAKRAGFTDAQAFQLIYAIFTRQMMETLRTGSDIDDDD